MAERNLVYFVADVHLGQDSPEAAAREDRFVRFLKELPAERMQALYLLGDIWDFWYEYRDVVPRNGVRVAAEMIRLRDAGVEVCFCPGNHDIWTFSLFKDLGIGYFEQPLFVNISGKEFCLGHGDLLGGATRGYARMMKLFHCRFAQRLFATLHPWLAYRMARSWAKSSRRKHAGHVFRREEEPLYKYVAGVAEQRHVDFFVFGHYHEPVDMTLPGGAKFYVLDDWSDGGTPYGVFNGSFFELRSPAGHAE